ncbi:tripartite tricarboxylate transporter substrate binding protein [Roseomonas sp. OT10]|uniref:Bug family tripartite tricarboxylate transporter substrate binding protein n=1 Tax=Roseomonas cutis TaxID=2897332 RepID=UPI001E4E1714|nr:tripartite tricarboxylate transporter substrate binding protein [Roseomonas sp. OT10]UFN50560.1 tripartite tricarboxylate transporter substrate binding protein [Roseomonas sp. OT10]
MRPRTLPMPPAAGAPAGQGALPRRALLAAAGAFGAPALMPRAARAQDGYPSRAVTIMVGFAPGGGADTIARLLGQRLQQSLGQPVPVENRPGGSGTIAVNTVLRARPDGYTFGVGTNSSNAIVPQLMTPPPYDVLKDQTPILHVGYSPQVLTVPASSPARDVQGFIAMVKAKPGAINYASSGVATQQHLAAEFFAKGIGGSMTHVPYRGSGQAISDLIAGQVDVNFDTLPTVLPHVRQGTLRALAVTTPQRVPWLPDVPTLIEAGVPEFDVVTRYIVFAPAGLPAPLAERWAGMLNEALADPQVKTRMNEAGFVPGGGTLASTAQLIRAEQERFGALARAANIRLE